eukprot:359649-Chlamydomonas_euryale.AAC.2
MQDSMLSTLNLIGCTSTVLQAKALAVLNTAGHAVELSVPDATTFNLLHTNDNHFKDHHEAGLDLRQQHYSATVRSLERVAQHTSHSSQSIHHAQMVGYESSSSLSESTPQGTSL